MSRSMGFCQRVWCDALALLTLGLILLSACSPADLATPVPATVTATPSLTPTIVWFPATHTPTPRPSEASTPTPEQRPGTGAELLADDFSQPELWTLRATDTARVQVSGERLVLAILQPGFYLVSLRREPVLTDFYAEITANTSLCRGLDEYGLLVRATSALDYYRLVLNCNGQVRLERVTNGNILKVQPDTFSGDVPPGAPGQVRIGLWAAGTELRVFLNGRFQFKVLDPVHRSGTLGVFARSVGETAVTITFSELVVQAVSYVSPTPTWTPSVTPIPTRTRQP
ncbi:MAG: hypothetical protein ACOYY3_10810 [Chloroflexota bacterium]